MYKRQGPGAEGGGSGGEDRDGAFAGRLGRRARCPGGTPATAGRPEVEGLVGALAADEGAGDGGQQGARPHPLRQRLDHGERGVGRPAVEQPLHPPVPPQGAGAVADDEGEVVARRVVQLVGGAQRAAGAGGRRDADVRAVRVEVMHRHITEGADPFADLAQVVQHLLPDGHRGRAVHQQPQRGRAAVHPAQHRDDHFGVGGELGGGGLVQLAADRGDRGAVALDGPQRALERQQPGERGGDRDGDLAQALPVRVGEPLVPGGQQLRDAAPGAVPEGGRGRVGVRGTGAAARRQCTTDTADPTRKVAGSVLS